MNKEIDINIYEYIAVIIGFIYAIKMLNRNNLSNEEGYIRNKRVHVHTDNTSCISWVQKRRSESPTHAPLLKSLEDAHRRTFLRFDFLQAGAIVKHIRECEHIVS